MRVFYRTTGNGRRVLTAPMLQEQELQWVIDETLQICQDLKHGLEDCYALLAPIDPGSTLAMVTSRSEMVKGTLTRVGTRIVKGVSTNPDLRNHHT